MFNESNNNEIKPKKKYINSISIIGGLIIIANIIIALYYYFIGFQKCVGDKKYAYDDKEIYIEHDRIKLYEKF